MVFRAAASEPASGSVRPKAARWPLWIISTAYCFWAGVPAIMMGLLARLLAPRALVMPASQRLSSSVRRHWVVMSIPSPPYSAGRATEAKPISTACL